MDNPKKLGIYGTENEVKQNRKHHYIHAYTNNVNKTCALLQTTEGLFVCWFDGA